MSESPTIGHNLPPDDKFARAAELVENANRWIKERPEIGDEEEAGAAQLAIDQLRKVKEDLEAELKERRQPHDQAIADLRVKFRDPLALVGIALNRLGAISAAWLQKKRDRLVAEKAEQERAAQVLRERANAAIVEAVTKPSVEADLIARRATEEAAQAAKLAGKPVARAQVRSDFVDKAMSLQARWSAEVIDETLALRSYSKHPAIRAAALAAVKTVASKEARDLKDESKAKPGIKFVRKEVAI